MDSRRSRSLMTGMKSVFRSRSNSRSNSYKETTISHYGTLSDSGNPNTIIKKEEENSHSKPANVFIKKNNPNCEKKKGNKQRKQNSKIKEKNNNRIFHSSAWNIFHSSFATDDSTINNNSNCSVLSTSSLTSFKPNVNESAKCISVIKGKDDEKKTHKFPECRSPETGTLNHEINSDSMDLNNLRKFNLAKNSDHANLESIEQIKHGTTVIRDKLKVNKLSKNTIENDPVKSTNNSIDIEQSSFSLLGLPARNPFNRDSWFKRALNHALQSEVENSNDVIVLALGIQQYIVEVFHRLDTKNLGRITWNDFILLCRVLRVSIPIEIKEKFVSLPDKCDNCRVSSKNAQEIKLNCNSSKTEKNHVNSSIANHQNKTCSCLSLNEFSEILCKVCSQCNGTIASQIPNSSLINTVVCVNRRNGILKNLSDYLNSIAVPESDGKSIDSSKTALTQNSLQNYAPERCVQPSSQIRANGFMRNSINNNNHIPSAMANCSSNSFLHNEISSTNNVPESKSTIQNFIHEDYVNLHKSILLQQQELHCLREVIEDLRISLQSSDAENISLKIQLEKSQGICEDDQSFLKYQLNKNTSNKLRNQNVTIAKSSEGEHKKIHKVIGGTGEKFDTRDEEVTLTDEEDDIDFLLQRLETLATPSNAVKDIDDSNSKSNSEILSRLIATSNANDIMAKDLQDQLQKTFQSLSDTQEELENTRKDLQSIVTQVQQKDQHLSTATTKITDLQTLVKNEHKHNLSLKDNLKRMEISLSEKDDIIQGKTSEISTLKCHLQVTKEILQMKLKMLQNTQEEVRRRSKERRASLNRLNIARNLLSRCVPAVQILETSQDSQILETSRDSQIFSSLSKENTPIEETVSEPNNIFKQHFQKPITYSKVDNLIMDSEKPDNVQPKPNKILLPRKYKKPRVDLDELDSLPSLDLNQRGNEYERQVVKNPSVPSIMDDICLENLKELQKKNDDFLAQEGTADHQIIGKIYHQQQQQQQQQQTHSFKLAKSQLQNSPLLTNLYSTHMPDSPPDSLPESFDSPELAYNEHRTIESNRQRHCLQHLSQPMNNCNVDLNEPISNHIANLNLPMRKANSDQPTNDKILQDANFQSQIKINKINQLNFGSYLECLNLPISDQLPNELTNQKKSSKEILDGLQSEVELIMQSLEIEEQSWVL